MLMIKAGQSHQDGPTEYCVKLNIGNRFAHINLPDAVKINAMFDAREGAYGFMDLKNNTILIGWPPETDEEGNEATYPSYGLILRINGVDVIGSHTSLSQAHIFMAEFGKAVKRACLMYQLSST